MKFIADRWIPPCLAESLPPLAKGQMRLGIEVVASSTHRSNLRAYLNREEWKKFARETYRKANYRCEICGGYFNGNEPKEVSALRVHGGSTHPVECHEVWDWNFASSLQKLVRLISLCPACHAVKHWHLSVLRFTEEPVMTWFCHVNGCTKKKARKYLDNLFDFHIENDFHKIPWNLDLSFLGKGMFSYEHRKTLTSCALTASDDRRAQIVHAVLVQVLGRHPVTKDGQRRRAYSNWEEICGVARIRAASEK